MRKHKYIAKLTSTQLTETIECYLESKDISIVSYSKILNIIVVESELDLMDEDLDYLIDIEEDQNISKAGTVES